MCVFYTLNVELHFHLCNHKKLNRISSLSVRSTLSSSAAATHTDVSSAVAQAALETQEGLQGTFFYNRTRLLCHPLLQNQTLHLHIEQIHDTETDKRDGFRVS